MTVSVAELKRQYCERAGVSTDLLPFLNVYLGSGRAMKPSHAMLSEFHVAQDSFLDFRFYNSSGSSTRINCVLMLVNPWLEPRDISQCNLVCRSWNLLLRGDQVWEPRLQSMGFASLPLGESAWLTYCRVARLKALLMSDSASSIARVMNALRKQRSNTRLCWEDMRWLAALLALQPEPAREAALSLHRLALVLQEQSHFMRRVKDENFARKFDRFEARWLQEALPTVNFYFLSHRECVDLDAETRSVFSFQLNHVSLVGRFNRVQVSHTPELDLDHSPHFYLHRVAVGGIITIPIYGDLAEDDENFEYLWAPAATLQKWCGLARADIPDLIRFLLLIANIPLDFPGDALLRDPADVRYCEHCGQYH